MNASEVGLFSSRFRSGSDPGKSLKQVALGLLVGVTGGAVFVSQGCSGNFSSCADTRTCAPPEEPQGGGGGAPDAMSDGGSESPAGAEGGEGGTLGVAGSSITMAGSGDAGEGLGGELGGGGAPPTTTCGNGKPDVGEECDLGAKNAANAYGPTACTDQCKKAPYCGDAKKNGPEACDDGGSSTELGSCNPACSGYYEKKFLRTTYNGYMAGSLGGIAGADAKCVVEFGDGWKALLVGAARRATVTPFLGDGPKDWVIRKYTHYYSYHEKKLVWRTDDVPLLGVRDGKRVNVYADAFAGGDYPWSGWNADWTTFPDNTPNQGTCASWTSTSAGWASFVGGDLMPAASEECGSTSHILCVEQ